MIDKILEERGARYGAFTDHAQICQDLKDVMRATPSWEKCTPDKKQALEVIADKIARMLNGDPNYDDNWVDIIGYSQLVLDNIKEYEGQTKMELYDPLEESDRPIGSLSEDRTCLWDGDKMIPRFGLEGQSLSRRYPQ